MTSKLITKTPQSLVLSSTLLLPLESKAQEFSPALPSHPANQDYINQDSQGLEITDSRITYGCVAGLVLFGAVAILSETRRSNREYDQAHKKSDSSR